MDVQAHTRARHRAVRATRDPDQPRDADPAAPRPIWSNGFDPACAEIVAARTGSIGRALERALAQRDLRGHGAVPPLITVQAGAAESITEGRGASLARKSVNIIFLIHRT
jgi:hypothetical protein